MSIHATKAPWHVSNRQIQEDFGLLFFAQNISAPNREFRLKVGWCGGTH